MAKHTKEQREFIVRKLAAFWTPSETIAHFRTRWQDTACDEIDVTALDPDNGAIIGPDEHTTFVNVRNATRAEMERLWPNVSESMRVMLLGMTRDHAVQRNRNAFELANKTAETFAKIESGFFSGKAGASPAPGGEASAAPTTITWKIVDPKGDV